MDTVSTAQSLSMTSRRHDEDAVHQPAPQQPDRSLITQLLRSRVPEGLQLEYKCLQRVLPFDRNDRLNLARSIASFANAAGGQLVLGIGTGKTSEKELPTHRCPLPYPRQVAEELHAELAQFIAPPVPGLQIHAIGVKSGYVVIDVPQSVEAPHMNMLQHQYPQRHGNRCDPMEHYQIADLFGRRRAPVVELVIDREGTLLEEQLAPSYSAGIQGGLVLSNRGHAVARDVTVFLNVHIVPTDPEPASPTAADLDFSVIGYGWNNVSSINPGIPAAWTLDLPRVLHTLPMRTHVGTFVARTVAPYTLVMSWQAYADNMPMQRGMHTLATRSSPPDGNLQVALELSEKPPARESSH